ncbi:MAG: 4'-phosphopantetheinyl transferase superfamily protein [Lutibacter sp.]|jgi:phosphopantetheinyl transferase|nr:4'-phosphopantetheinyl transferase superfamily protein [Lutibacter sp.]
MPFYKILHPNQYSTVYLWKIGAEDCLSEGIALTERSQHKLLAMRSEAQKQAYKSVRQLLKIAGYTDADLFYDDRGKPHLKDQKYVSISHSFGFAALAVSEQEIGVDVEKKRPKIAKIRHKFVHPEKESLCPSDDPLAQLTVIWGAKEALYKIYPYGGLNFKEQLCIEPFRLDDQKTTGRLCTGIQQNKYEIQFEPLEDHILVCALATTAHD